MPLLFSAQTILVKGVIFEKKDNTPLPGVTIFNLKTDAGTISNNDGTFEIQASLGDTLTCSFIGMKTEKWIVTSEEASIMMEPDANILNEVEVVSYGYYDVNKKDLTGAVSQVTSKELEKNRSTSVENLLQGQIAGVVVNESSEPGGGVGVSIRGTNSMLGGTQPLYVVDGIPMDPLSDAQGNDGAGQQQSALNFINPNDIEKIEVLKDAAATAIYGARGANGVVIITTKSGKDADGKDKISGSIDLSISEVIKKIDVLDGQGFESYMNQRRINQLYQDITDPNRSGIVFDGTQALTSANFPELSNFNLPYSTSTGVNTRWQDETYRLAFSKIYNVGYRSGTPKKNLSISMGLVDNEGVIVNSDFKRMTLSVNSRRTAFNDRIKILSKSNLSYKKGNAVSVGNGEIFQQRSVVSQALQFQPIFGLLEINQDDDIYADLNEGNIVSNPYTLANFVQDKKEAFVINQNLTLVGKINRRWTATLKGALNYQRANRDNYYPTNTTRGRRNNGEASQAYNQNIKFYTEASLRYKRNFKDRHRVNANLVGTYERNNIRSSYQKAFGFGSDLTSFYTFKSATDILVPITQFREVGLLSGLARVGYNYKWKYYVDVNARMDASSKFAANNKAALFPSIAFAWVPSREDFLKDSKNISFLKLRLSYGKTGSNPIEPYQSLALLEPIRYNFDGTIATGYYEANLANDDLTWETTDQYNGGIDLRMYDDKLSFTIDAYYKKTHNLLQLVNLPASNGYATRVDNFGSVENKGIEFSIKKEILQTENFAWDVTGNFGLNRNKLLELNSNIDFQLGPFVGFAQANPTMFMEGQPLGIFWGVQTDGIYSTWEEANASGIEGAAPGEIKYVNNNLDVDETGEPLAIQQINFDDYVKIGDPNPDFTVAITNNFTFKNWDINVLFTGQKGGDIFWVDSWQLEGLTKSTNVLAAAFENSWVAPLSISDGNVNYDPSVENTANAIHPAAIVDISARALVSDRQLFDGSFIKLKNINIGYTFNLPKKGSLKFYLAGRNLFVWTKYPGYDPEIQTYYRNPQKRGIDFGSYPGTKTYTFGIKFNY